MCISLPMLMAKGYGMNFNYIAELEGKYGNVYVLIPSLMGS